MNVDDLLATGFKKSKTYNVEGLPEATSAYFGFWGPDPYNRLEYEARFYRSHEDAVEYGTPLAEERVGRDAKLTPETATWKEGIKDARQCVAVGGGLEAASTCLEPKFFDYVIYGNMVLLCMGLDSGQSLENCAALISRMH